MNTVDALKDLYKTLCGKDYAGDPNPTDAEMIKAIAKDASTGGGSGSGGGRIIDFEALERREEVDPESDEDLIVYFSGYEAGLSEEDFINSWFRGLKRGKLVPILEIGTDEGFVMLGGTSTPYAYNPETGEFSFVIAGGNPK